MEIQCKLTKRIAVIFKNPAVARWYMSEHGLFHFGNDKTKIVRIMRKSAIRTTFDVLQFADVLERTAAMFAERIQRTITKQAVERNGSDIFVTRKIATLRVFKKFVAVLHDNILPFLIRAAIVRLRRCFPQSYDCGSEFHLWQIHHISACRIVHVRKHFRCRCIGNKLNMPVAKCHIDSAAVLTA